MVASVSASLYSSLTGTSSSSEDPQEAARKESDRIKAEILSLQSELQCVTCEDDEADLEEQIADLESRLQQVETNSRVEPAEASGATGQTSRTGEDGGSDGFGARRAGEEPAVLIDPQTAERAREAASALAEAQSGGLSLLEEAAASATQPAAASASQAAGQADNADAADTVDAAGSAPFAGVASSGETGTTYGARGQAQPYARSAPGSLLDISI